MNKKQAIITEFREQFNISTVFHSDNFEDSEYIDKPYYNNAGVVKAFEQFLSQKLDEYGEEMILKLIERDSFIHDESCNELCLCRDAIVKQLATSKGQDDKED